ncbi:MAG TPA: hypothetical protein VMC44_07105 [Geobacteraceae bacterium]|nr:hypothetical protein [Geobacteraceae bacterium]
MEVLAGAPGDVSPMPRHQRQERQTSGYRQRIAGRGVATLCSVLGNVSMFDQSGR